MLVSWNITNACNLSCKHCCRDAGAPAVEELTTAEGFGLIDEIAAAGFKIMIFSGGEPLLRGDLFALVQHAANRGLRPVCGTNGLLLTRVTAEKLKQCGVAGVGISLDSVVALKHDRFRGLTGAWQETVRGIKACRDAGLSFQIHTTVTDWNAAEIEELTDWAVRSGASAHHLFFLLPTGRAAQIAEHALPAAQYERLLERIIAKQAQVPIELKPTCAPQFMRVVGQRHLATRFSRGCLAGIAYCVITPIGNVQPCAYFETVVGNVRANSFSAIWRSNPVFDRLRALDYGGACGVCHYQKVCGGCRARANHYYGDFMAQDPLCRYQAGNPDKLSGEEYGAECTTMSLTCDC